jgi:hypothetical protein
MLFHRFTLTLIGVMIGAILVSADVLLAPPSGGILGRTRLPDPPALGVPCCCTDIGGELPPNFEPSGAAWDPVLQRLYVVSDEGDLVRMNDDGTAVQIWHIGGDIEAVCLASPQPYRVYIGREQPDAVLEFDVVNGLVLRTFDLTPWMHGPANQGLEGLTFVPDSEHPEGGIFYASLEFDGNIRRFSLPIVTGGTTVTYEGLTLTPRAHLCGLDYQNGELIAVYNDVGVLHHLSLQGQLLEACNFPGIKREGVSARTTDLFLAHDLSSVYRCDNWLEGCCLPVVADVDGDGDTDLDDYSWARSCLTGPRTHRAEDFDGDGDVDLDDYAEWQTCLRGPTTPIRAAKRNDCEAMDLDADGDVDIADFALLQLSFGAPTSAILSPTCAIVDLDADKDVDLADLAAFQRAFTQ